MRTLHLLSGGAIGGIEVLCRDISDYSKEVNDFCFLFSGGPITEYMKQNNKNVSELYQVGKLRRFLSFYQLIRKQDYDAIVVHHEGFGIYLFYLFAHMFFGKKKYIRYIHSAYDESILLKGKPLFDFVYKKIIHKTLVKSDIIIAVSNFVKESFVESFQLDGERVRVIYNGIVIPEGSALVEKGGDITRLLYIGRVAKGKGIPSLIHTVKDLKELQLSVSLTVVGDGDAMEECVSLVKQLNLQDTVLFEGYQLEKERYYAESHIFVYPSVVKEAFGISIVEAMARGMLVIGRNIGGIPELLQDGKNGFLFQDDSDLKNVIAGIIQDRSKEELQIIQKNAIRCAGEFDIINTVAQLDQIIKETVKG